NIRPRIDGLDPAGQVAETCRSLPATSLLQGGHAQGAGRLILPAGGTARCRNRVANLVVREVEFARDLGEIVVLQIMGDILQRLSPELDSRAGIGQRALQAEEWLSHEALRISPGNRSGKERQRGKRLHAV